MNIAKICCDTKSSRAACALRAWRIAVIPSLLYFLHLSIAVPICCVRPRTGTRIATPCSRVSVPGSPTATIVAQMGRFYSDAFVLQIMRRIVPQMHLVQQAESKNDRYFI